MALVHTFKMTDTCVSPRVFPCVYVHFLHICTHKSVRTLTSCLYANTLIHGQVAGGTVTFEGLLTASGNSAAGTGGFLHVIDGVVKIRNAVMSDNQAPRGGLMRIANSGSVLCTNCTIQNSLATVNGYSHGGVLLMSGGFARLERCTLEGSSATWGGVVSLMSGRLEVIDSLIRNSSAALSGGLGFMQGGVATFEGTAMGMFSAGSGGALFLLSGSNIQLRSSTITSSVSKGLWVKRGVGSFACFDSHLIGKADSNTFLFEATAQQVSFSLCSLRDLKIASAALLQPMRARNSRWATLAYVLNLYMQRPSKKCVIQVRSTSLLCSAAMARLH